MKSKSTLERILLYGCSLIVIVLAAFTIKKEFMSTQVAYVEIGRLVDNYKLKLDLEKAHEGELQRVKTVIDSLRMVKKVEGDRITRTDSQLVYAESAFEKYYIASNQEITQKIWERLNPLMLEYGKDRNLDILIGANGTGTVLYGSKQKDVTDDVLAYINQKYEKGN